MKLRRYLAALKRKVKTPPYLLFFVTARCDAQCRHCFYWRSTNQIPDELSLEEIEKVSHHAGEILQLTLTGGDAAQRDDLPAIAQVFAKRNGVLNVTIGTNGFRTARVLAHARVMLENLPPYTNLTIDLSLDGLGSDHDEIRNTPGIFDAVVATHHGLKQLQKEHPRLNTCIDVTVSTFNQFRLRPLYDFVVNDLRPDVVNALYIRGEPRDAEAKGIEIGPYVEICRWIREDTAAGKIPGYGFFTDILHAKDFILRDIIVETARDPRYRYPCTAARLTGVIYPQGDVAACEMRDDLILGNLRAEDYNLETIWQSPRGREVRDLIARERCYCVHQCFLSNNILFNPKLTPRLIAETAKLKWARTARPTKRYE